MFQERTIPSCTTTMDAVGFGGVLKCNCGPPLLTAGVSDGFETGRGMSPAFASPGREPDGDAVDVIPGDCTGGHVGFLGTAGGAGAGAGAGAIA